MKILMKQLENVQQLLEQNQKLDNINRTSQTDVGVLSSSKMIRQKSPLQEGTIEDVIDLDSQLQTEPISQGARPKIKNWRDFTQKSRHLSNPATGTPTQKINLSVNFEGSKTGPVVQSQGKSIKPVAKSNEEIITQSDYLHDIVNSNGKINIEFRGHNAKIEGKEDAKKQMQIICQAAQKDESLDKDEQSEELLYENTQPPMGNSGRGNIN